MSSKMAPNATAHGQFPISPTAMAIQPDANPTIVTP